MTIIAILGDVHIERHQVVVTLPVDAGQTLSAVMNLDQPGRYCCCSAETIQSTEATTRESLGALNLFSEVPAAMSYGDAISGIIVAINKVASVGTGTITIEIIVFIKN